MKRTRIFVFASTLVVVLGVVAALSAVWLDPLRAAIGPLPAEALLLPGDSRFVIGIDVRRFTASPFYARFAKQRGMRPDALRDLEEKAGLDLARDVDTIVVAGGGDGDRQAGTALAIGRFDAGKLRRALEAAGRVRGYEHGGATVYAVREDGERALAVAFLDERSLLFGPKARVEAAVESRTRGEAPLRANASLLALVAGVRPGSTFWMVGDQSLLAGLPATVPAPGAGGGSVTLPALRSLVVTGDLDPEVSLSVTGEAGDAEKAHSLADLVRGGIALVSLQARQKPELQQLASAVTVATEASRVLVTARVPYALIDALAPAQGPPLEPPAGPPPAAK